MIRAAALTAILVSAVAAIAVHSQAADPQRAPLVLAGRYEVEVTWKDFEGTEGLGHLVRIDPEPSTPGAKDKVDGSLAQGGVDVRGLELRSEGSAVVELYTPNSWEVLVKVLDGRRVNGHFWVYLATATTVGYEIRVVDTVCGKTRRYAGRRGEAAAAVTDSEAFRACPSRRPASCVEEPGVLCLGKEGRFRVEIEWADYVGNRGPGRQARLASPGPAANGEAALLYFFVPGNWEMLVRVVDGCRVNGHIWVFAGTTSDVEHRLRVRDLVTGVVREYTSPLGEPAQTVSDLRAFSCKGGP